MQLASVTLKKWIVLRRNPNGIVAGALEETESLHDHEFHPHDDHEFMPVIGAPAEPLVVMISKNLRGRDKHRT